MKHRGFTVSIFLIGGAREGARESARESAREDARESARGDGAREIIASPRVLP
jgi:hypothetical protein